MQIFGAWGHVFEIGHVLVKSLYYKCSKGQKVNPTAWLDYCLQNPRPHGYKYRFLQKYGQSSFERRQNMGRKRGRKSGRKMNTGNNQKGNYFESKGPKNYRYQNKNGKFLIQINFLEFPYSE